MCYRLRMRQASGVSGLSQVIDLHSGRVELDTGRLLDKPHVNGLSDLERRLLGWLYEHAGQEVSRDRLFRSVWGHHGAGGSRAVDLAVRRLRMKIELDPSNPTHILSVYGVGYRFVA